MTQIVAPASAGVVFHQGGRALFLRRFAGFQNASFFIRNAFFAGMRSSVTADAPLNDLVAQRTRTTIDVDRELSDAPRRRANEVPGVCC
jgi:hypothetical protein